MTFISTDGDELCFVLELINYDEIGTCTNDKKGFNSGEIVLILIFVRPSKHYVGAFKIMSIPFIGLVKLEKKTAFTYNLVRFLISRNVNLS